MHLRHLQALACIFPQAAQALLESLHVRGLDVARMQMFSLVRESTEGKLQHAHFIYTTALHFVRQK